MQTAVVNPTHLLPESRYQVMPDATHATFWRKLLAQRNRSRQLQKTSIIDLQRQAHGTAALRLCGCPTARQDQPALIAEVKKASPSKGCCGKILIQ